MPTKQSGGDNKRADREPKLERREERGSLGSGEEEKPADIQPDDVENGTPR
ncbi:MAG TPA: hypothetical protein VM692_17250 [Gammaproteobacteria bacterium]|nr:hypothetical protein [Gammaproteobacteria bacterium]